MLFVCVMLCECGIVCVWLSLWEGVAVCGCVWLYNIVRLCGVCLLFAFAGANV